MIEDRKLLALWQDLRSGMPLWKAAARSGMEEKTARKYRDAKKLPSTDTTAHTWRTCPDPFSDACMMTEIRPDAADSPKTSFKTRERFR
jgi:hypothetical protein